MSRLITKIVAVLLLVGATGFILQWKLLEQTRQVASTVMQLLLDQTLHRLEGFHEEAGRNLLTVMESQVFIDYMELPDTKAGNHYDSAGALQLSAAQNELRVQMERASAALQRRFPIGETCLVDKRGQEHLRVVHGVVEDSQFFSSEEGDSPFFVPTYQLERGEVNLSPPYMSADSFQWVVAFSSPFVLQDGTKPAFLHFEIPLSFYHDVVTDVRSEFFRDAYKLPHHDDRKDLAVRDRYLIVDGNGRVIVDSTRRINVEIPAERNPAKAEELPDYLPPEKMDDYFKPVVELYPGPEFAEVVQHLLQRKDGIARFNSGGVEHLAVYRPLPFQQWQIVMVQPLPEITARLGLAWDLRWATIVGGGLLVLVVVWGWKREERPAA